MPKAKIYATNANTVMCEYDDAISNERREREFMAPAAGGYVREMVSGNWEQVCDGLANRGPTLYLHKNGDLLARIRSEYRAMRRTEKSILG